MATKRKKGAAVLKAASPDTSAVFLELERLRHDAVVAGDLILVGRCDQAGECLAGSSVVRLGGPVDQTCTVCGETIKPGMVTQTEVDGVRHVPGAIVCRRGGTT